MKIEKYGSRNWAVLEDDGSLVCVTVYKRGAQEVMRRLTILDSPPHAYIDAARILTLIKEFKSLQKKFNLLAASIKTAAK